MRRIPAVVAALAALVLAACGGGSPPPPPPPPPISVTVSPASATIPVQRSQLFTALVSNSNNQAVTWKVNGVVGGNATVGVINSSGFYTAPDLVPNPSSVTVTAVAKADSTKSATASVKISIAVSPPNATLLIQTGSQQFTAVGTNDPVNWSITCAAPCDASTLGNIDASGLYTAPNAIPDNVLTDPSLQDPRLGISASAIVVKAALQSDASNSSSANVFVNAGGPSVNQSPHTELGSSGGNSTDITGNFCCSGTLGSLVVRAGTNFVLSNNHVLARRDQAKAGESITQPGLVDTNCTPAQKVAAFSQAAPLKTSGVDAALAQVVSGQIDSTGTILQLGSVSNGLAQTAQPANSVVAAAVDMPVAKSGRTTGLSCSAISLTNLTVTVDYETGCNGGTNFQVKFLNQIDIQSTTFSAPGDSGSLIVDATTAQPVALLFAGSSSDTVANPINADLTALKDSKGNKPTIVGGAQHEVAACTGQVGPAPPREIAAPQPIEDAELQRAITAKEAHVDELMSIPAVIGVGVGAADTPGQAAVVVIVEKGKKAGAIPTEVDGVPVKIRESSRFRAFIPRPPAWMCAAPELFDLPGSSRRRLQELGLGDLSAAGDSEARLQSRQHAPCVKE